MLLLFAIHSSFCAGLSRAQTKDYAADAGLASQAVDMTLLSGRVLPLGRVIAYLEAETGTQVTYPAGELPLDMEVRFEVADKLSLARVLTVITEQTHVAFERRDQTLVARRDEAPAAASATPVAFANPRIEMPRAVGGAAAEVSTVSGNTDIGTIVAEIVAKNGLSRDKKEKQISAAVRQAVLEVGGAQTDSQQGIAAACTVVEHAAASAPAFVETIARAAAFTPVVSHQRGAAAQVRAAAYGAGKSPAPAVARRAAVSGGGPRVQLPSSLRPETREPAASGYSARSSYSPTAESPSSATGPASATESGASNPLAEMGRPQLQIPAASPAATGDTGTGTTTASGADDVVKMARFSVQGATAKGSVGSLRSERAKAAVAIDYLSADQLAKYAAADLSEVVFRIPGVSVANGQYAVVRGLSDRFLSTTLQGVKLPTPDPEKQAVQLDLLPSSAVEAVVVAKTYDASQWAESAGGNLDVRTRAVPTESLLRLSAGIKANSNATDGAPDYEIRGAANERFGYGSRSRLGAGKSDPTWQYVPAFRGSMPLGNKLELEFAHAFAFGEQKLGVLFNAFNEVSYKASRGRKQAKGAKTGTPATPAKPATGSTPAIPANPGRASEFETGLPTAEYVMYDYAKGETENVLGLTTAEGYKFSPNHEIKLTAIYVQSGIDQSQVNETALTTDPDTGLPKPIAGRVGFASAETNSWYNTFEYFRERNLTVVQLAGTHKFPVLGDLKVDWAAQHGSSYQKDSPFVEAVFASPLTNLHKVYTVIGGNDAPQTMRAVWADNDESQKTGRLDVAWPFKLWSSESSTLSAGFGYNQTERETSGISIDYKLASNGSLSAQTPSAAVARIVNPAQGGIATPATSAEREISAWYLGTSLAVVDNIKVVAGARYEDYLLSTSGSGRWGGTLTSALFYGNNPAKGILGALPANNPPFGSRTWYPGMGVVLGPWANTTIRLHYSKTSGRPSLREVSPFFNKSIETGNLVIGNPALKPSSATNYDVRVEWTPTKSDLVSVSAFRKDIENPIEKMLFTQTIPPVGDATESWVNNPSRAKVQGLEFEVKHSLKSWSELFRNFAVSGNFTWIDASVGENPRVLTALLGVYQDPARIPTSRRLFDQPEYIANVDLTWTQPEWGTTVTLAGYAISDVLTATGKPDFFDLYERAYSRFDLIVGQRLSTRLKLKVSVKNFTNPVRGLIYDREATKALVERDTYRAGREYAGSLTYDF